MTFVALLLVVALVWFCLEWQGKKPPLVRQVAFVVGLGSMVVLSTVHSRHVPRAEMGDVILVGFGVALSSILMYMTLRKREWDETGGKVGTFLFPIDEATELVVFSCIFGAAWGLGSVLEVSFTLSRSGRYRKVEG